jgi:hypothetical protein
MGIKALSWVRKMIFFLDSHEVLLRNQNVCPLLLLIVEFLNQFAIGLGKVSFFFRIMGILNVLLTLLNRD